MYYVGRDPLPFPSFFLVMHNNINFMHERDASSLRTLQRYFPHKPMYMHFANPRPHPYTPTTQHAAQQAVPP